MANELREQDEHGDNGAGECEYECCQPLSQGARPQDANPDEEPDKPHDHRKKLAEVVSCLGHSPPPKLTSHRPGGGGTFKFRYWPSYTETAASYRPNFRGPIPLTPHVPGGVSAPS